MADADDKAGLPATYVHEMGSAAIIFQNSVRTHVHEPPIDK